MLFEGNYPFVRKNQINREFFELSTSLLYNGEKTQIKKFLEIIDCQLAQNIKEKIIKKFKHMFLMPDELEEPNLKYENENMYNLFNLIKSDVQEFLNGDKVAPDALANDLGEFKD